MAAKKKKGAKKASKPVELIISKSRVKAAVKKCNVGGEFYGALDGAVRELIKQAEGRAQGNKRKAEEAWEDIKSTFAGFVNAGRPVGPKGRNLAAEAAFRGHGSLKHVVVVDDDIDLYDSHDVEWAIATRFQADRDLMVWENQPSSSLDPSATHVPGQKSRSAKMGLDATIPWDQPDSCTRLHEFVRVPFPKADVSAYL